MRILLLSDTHSFLDDRILAYAQTADEIWHAGDFGTLEILEKLKSIKPVRAVFGNIDDQKIRQEIPEILNFTCANVSVLMIHIGGYPKRYSARAKEQIELLKPQLFISGHSHILKAMYDEKYQLLHLNPGACGKQGWHKMRTMMQFEINGSQIENLNIIELGKR